MKKCLLNLSMLIGILFSFNGCLLAPFINSVAEAGFTESDRQRLLAKNVKEFQDYLYWSDPSKALSLTTSESREEMQNQLWDAPRDIRIVESKIDCVRFADEAHSADVEVRVKYYRQSSYIVRERVDHQMWKFTVADGWRISSRNIIEEHNS